MNIQQFRDQWQVALIWMRDVNMAATETTPRGLLDRLASGEIAEYYLNRYFEMVEAQLMPPCQIDSGWSGAPNQVPPI